MDKVIIRKGTKKDIKEMARIFREEYAKKPWNEKWTEKNSIKKIKNYFNNKHRTYVCEIDKETVGFIIIDTFVWASGKEGFIDQIIVSEKYQGKGIGKTLFEKAEDYFRKKGIKGVTLYTNVKSNAAGFYERRGYKQGDMVIYSKKLK
jgi:ribosomal protein S18 acetylase RimI-like enzyme